MRWTIPASLLMALLVGCGAQQQVSSSPVVEPPEILLVTLDTTRVDALSASTTPEITRLAERGLWFEQAYATAPQTLPSHTSMMTGVYPAEHGVHENARFLAGEIEPLAVHLGKRGYRSVAVVSAYTLEAGLGLERGFATYDDEFAAGALERDATATTDRALAQLSEFSTQPHFLWVHYFDPHDPYQPPEPWATRFADQPYLGELAYLDHELGRLFTAFAERPGSKRIVLVGDHGESLGEHGEATHGNLLYQGVMRVPLVLAGDGIAAARRDEPVSTRRIFDTVLGWAGGDGSRSLEQGVPEMVMGEAMQPFLSYGWSPQVMVVQGQSKLIRAARHELYDVVADPLEQTDLAQQVDLDREMVRTARDYPVPSTPAAAPLDPEQLAKLASLGYTGSAGSASVRVDAPSPKDMVHLLPALERGSALFVHGRYRESIPLFRGVLDADPKNLMVAVRLGVAHSILGEYRAAEDFFEQARSIDSSSLDAMLYRALHLARMERWAEAEPQLELVLARDPNRTPALEALAGIRERQGRLGDAAALLTRLAARSRAPGAVWLRLGEISMQLGDTAEALRAFEAARATGAPFSHHLELGVLYLAERRVAEAATELDQVPQSHPAYELAQFKRAQASVLLGEADASARVEQARNSADPEVRALAERERLFQGR